MPGETQRVVGQQEATAVGETSTSSPWLQETPPITAGARVGFRI